MNQDLQILYSSITGTSEFLAQQLSNQLTLRGINSSYKSLSEYQIQNLPNETHLIFIISTIGQGDPPQSMMQFYRTLLIKNLQPDLLKNLNFSVFGCGDSSYKQFNAAARKLYQRLIQLGAQVWVPRGLGDEQDRLGIFQEFIEWKKEIFKGLKLIYQQNDLLDNYENIIKLTKPSYQIEIIQEKIQCQTKTTKKTYSVTLVQNLIKNSQEFSVIFLSKTYQVQFQSDQSYQPGDIVEIFPENDIKLVNTICELQKYNPQDQIQLINKQQATLFQGSLSSFLQKQLNLSMPVNQHALEILFLFSSDNTQKEKLQEMSSLTKDGLETFYEYVTREKRNIVEILYDFDSVKIPLEYLIEAIGFQKPREYSISSYDKNFVEVTAAVKQCKTPFNRKVTGVCSSYLQNIQVGKQVVYQIKKGLLQFPLDNKQFSKNRIPVILVGPGTGIAPIMSFLRKRFQNVEDSGNFGETMVIFGSKNQNMDFYYSEYLSSLQNQNKINLITAFSRDQSHKIYVQHKIQEHGQKIFDLINQNISEIQIIVCGNSKNMPDQVEESFKAVMGSYFNDQEKGSNTIEQLKKSKQYQIESW